MGFLNAFHCDIIKKEAANKGGNVSYRIYANAYIDDEVCGHFQLFDNNELPEDFACWLIEQGFECKNGNIGTFEGFEVSPVALAQCCRLVPNIMLF